MKYKLLILASLVASTVAAQDTLFVHSAVGANRIIRYHFPSRTILNMFGGNISGQDMVQDAQGNLLICDQSTAQVKKYNPSTGAYLGVVCTGIVSDFFGIALLPDGTILVNGAYNGSVLKFHPTTGQFLGYFVPEGTAGLAQTRGMTFGPDGDLYVCSRFIGVFRFNGTTGAHVRTISIPNESDRCTIGPDGRLYVTGERNVVHVANPNTGAYIGQFVTPAQGLTNARAIQFGPDGYLYVANMNTATIFKINGTTGIFDSIFASGAPILQAAGMKFGSGTRVVSGRLRLRNRDQFAPPLSTVQMEFRPVGSQSVIYTRTVSLNAAFEFVVDPPMPVGAYDLSIKHSHWLRRTVTVDTTSGDVVGLQLLCTNGDCDLDNEVGPGDFGMLSSAFGTVIGDGGYNPHADLDEDGEVGPADFGVLSANFGSSGDL